MKNSDFFKRISKELHPKSKLFLSADLTSSSNQKQPVSQLSEYDDDFKEEDEFSLDPVIRVLQVYKDDRWFSYLTEFYQKFHHIFSGELNILIDADERDSKDRKKTARSAKLSHERLKVWKLVGDEIIYAVDIFNESEVYLISLAFVRSIVIYRKILHNDTAYFRSLKGQEFKSYRDQFSALYSGCILDVKGTIWCAGFPISNRELVVSDKLNVVDEALRSTDPRYRNLYLLKSAIDHGIYDNGSTMVDYLGPSIDIGFRLASLSSAGHLSISVEVAYLLNKCDDTWTGEIEASTKTRKPLVLKFSGRQTLKGVFGLKPYPIFWLDSSSNEGLSVIENNMFGSNEIKSRKNLIKYFDRVFERHSRYLNRPELIDMDDEFDDDSIICEVISRIDTVWRQEQLRMKARESIYEATTDDSF